MSLSPWPPALILALYAWGCVALAWGCVALAWFMIAIGAWEPPR